MKVLFDTNIVMDIVLDRKPYSASAIRLFSLTEKGGISGVLCATTLTTVHYLVRKELGMSQAHHILRLLLSLFEIAPVNRAVLESAWNMEWKDFEDGVMHEAARESGVPIIVTRDKEGFSKATLAIMSPDQFLDMKMSLN